MKNTLVGLGAAATLLGGGAAVRDVSTLDVAPIERVEIIAGERVETKQIENTVEATFPWKDQPAIKVKYDMGEPTVEEKAKDVRKKQIITETVTDFDGGFKVDIILSERPDTNRFCYTIEGVENYDFFYQPPLTVEEIAEGASRPPEIEGSYAVYHKTLANHQIGKENYATGKVIHIPRPRVWSLSDENTKEWADLSYDENGLCVTAPQDFLDKATYPVRIDPTFGYTSLGGTCSAAIASQSSDTSQTIGNNYSLTENGTLDSIHVGLDASSATESLDLFAALYREDSGGAGTHSLVASVERLDVSVNTTAAFYVFTASSQSLTSDTYIIAALGNGEEVLTVANSIYVCHDVTGSKNLYNELTTGAGSYATRKAEDPWTESASASGNTRSFYVTYTAVPCDAGETCTSLFADPGSYAWTAPTGITTVDAACWGGGGGAGDGNGSGGGGGGGGAFASSTVAVTAGSIYTVTVGAGGVSNAVQTPGTNGGTSTFATTTVVAAPGWGGRGASGVDNAGGLPGSTASSTGDVEFAGGTGGIGRNTGDTGGGGGGGAGPNGAGGTGAAGDSSVGGGGGGGNGGSNGSGITGGLSTNGGAGGNGASVGAGVTGTSSAKGGGGGGGGDDTFAGGNGATVGAGGGGGEANSASIGNGAAGQCTLTYTVAAGGETTPASYILWFD